jgi:RimJ/RimL family protein N-acetyltransferase
MLLTLTTARLWLIPISKIIARKLTDVNIEKLCSDLKINVTNNANYLNLLSELGVYFWAIADAAPWCAYLFIDSETKTVVGNGGFKGAPKNNTLEIGYEVYHKFYRRGYATEAVKGLLDLAESKKIKTIIAETEVENTASIRVLEKNGFLATKFFINEDGEHMRAFEHKFA